MFGLKWVYDKLSHKVRTLTITRRLVIIFIYSTVIPILLICLFSSIAYKKSTYKKLEESIEQMLLAHNITITKEINQQKKYSYNFLSNDEILHILEVEPEAVTIDMGYAIVTNMLTEYIWSTACENIVVTDMDNNIRGSGGTDELKPEFIQSINEQLIESDKNDCWSQTKLVKGSNVLVFSKKIYSKVNRGKLIGYLHMVYNEKRLFEEIYKSFEVGENSSMFILDENFKYISKQFGKEEIGKNILDTENITSELLTKESFITDYNNRKSLIVINKNEEVGWHLVATISCDYINKDINKTLITLFILAMFIVVLSIFPILLVSSTIILPMKQLSQFMNQVVKGQYECDVVEECEDEIGQLTKNCDNTVKHLVKLMEENYQKSIHQRELELQRLQAQINPHFLFNTLNSFKYIAMLNNMPVLEEGITSFCNLLRQTIVLEDELIPIEQEFDNIKNYCKVQSIRYAGRFELVCSIDNKVKDKKIPRMILQPLVENCLIHGMKEDVLLNIELNAFEEDTKIIILIQDDGKGMDINHDVISKNKSICFNRIGLENVKERLEIIYSGKSVLKIYSEKDKGTEIRLEIEGYYV